MLWNMDCNVLFDVSTDLGSSFFSYKTAKAADINILTGS